MSRETSPYIFGDYWLDKRSDGRSPDIWQITTYEEETRSYRYRSTRCSSLEDAKRAIKAYVAGEDARKDEASDLDSISVVAQLILYWDEHGKETIGNESIGSYIRHFIAFLRRDEVTIECSFADLKPNVWKRFIRWRQGPHAYTLTFKGQEYKHRSDGVVGATVRKNIRIVAAALNHAVNEGRAPSAPKPPKLDDSFNSTERNKVFSIEELGALVGYARHSPVLSNFVLLMLATAMRPEAALQMVPSQQFDKEPLLLDLHPKGAPRTKKRNPIIPCIHQFAALIDGHEGLWVVYRGEKVDSLRKRWATFRELFGYGDEVVTKTIRHSVASHLEYQGCDEKQIERLLGHVGENSTSAKYKHYNPNFMRSVREGLETLWDRVMTEADKWCAEHAVANGPNGKRMIIKRDGSSPFSNTGVWTIEEAATDDELLRRKRARQDQINAARRARKEKVRTSSPTSKKVEVKGSRPRTAVKGK